MVVVAPATSYSGLLGGFRIYIYNCLYYVAVIIIMYQLPIKKSSI